jgi:hypothetical protein
MGRTPNDIDTEQVVQVILQMIDAHRGKPCPTRREIVAWTGLPRREVWPFLKRLTEREPPLIELEERLHARAGARRLRLAGGEWTDWTVRRTLTREDQAIKRTLMREKRNAN